MVNFAWCCVEFSNTYENVIILFSCLNDITLFLNKIPIEILLCTWNYAVLLHHAQNKNGPCELPVCGEHKQLWLDLLLVGERTSNGGRGGKQSKKNKNPQSEIFRSILRRA